MLSAVGSAFTGAIASEIISSLKEMFTHASASSSSASFHIPELPKNPVRLDHRVEELKTRLFKENVSKVGVSAIGGSGKTTLAAALCKDPQVEAKFGDYVIFQTVSQSPNIMGILESMWERITKNQQEPSFRSIEDAHNRLQQWLHDRKSQYWFLPMKPENILVVLDDVWPEVDLQPLLFEAEGFKTVVMARHIVKWVDDTYELDLLEEADALSLFRSWAFKEQSIRDNYSNIDDTLVKQVAAECQGLPLALEVIGRSLFEHPRKCWEYAHKQLSQGESIDKDHENELLKRMAISTETLDDDMKQCFLDLGLFPEKQKISVAALFDIWMYVHNIEPIRAYKILHELESRKLLNLVNDLPGDHPRTYYCSTSELYIVQHDILRSMAIYLAAIEQPENICKRLRLSPKNWEKHSSETIIAAEIISIRTGPMNENQWPKMEFQKAEALVLIFDGKEYFLPTFLQKMPTLKVLIIINQNSLRTKLGGMSAFNSLAQLRSLRLEKLTLHPLGDYIRSSKNKLRALDDLAGAIVTVPLNIPGSPFSRGIKARKTLLKKIHECIKERKEHPEVVRSDLLTHLVKEATFPEEIIADLIMSLFFASYETSSKALTFAVKFLTDSPRALEEMRAEHDALVRAKGDERLTWEDYASMNFTHWVIKETLRLGNVAPAVFREAAQDIKTKDFVIPKGWAILVLLNGTHLDEKNYSEPMTFNPWRWQDEPSLELSKDPWFLCFGGGARFCPGYQFAKLEMALFLHCFITKFRWEAVEEDHLHYFPYTYMVKGLPLRLSPRE